MKMDKIQDRTGAIKKHPTSFYKLAGKCVALGLIVTMVLPFAACGNKQSKIVSGSSVLPMPSKKVEEVTVPANKNEVKFTGVLTLIDTTLKKMQFVDIDNGTEYEVAYTGGTDIQDKYNKILAAASMKAGDIFDVTCNKSSKAEKIYESSDTWEMTGFTGFQADESKKKVTIGDEDYKYVDYTAVISGQNRIAVAQVVAQDEITVRGKDKTIYSVTVDKGHGYIQFAGIDTFENGYATIGRKQLLGVTKNMLVTAQEGTYSVELQKGGTVGQKSVTVVRDQQVTLDFSEYTKEAAKTGAVNFMVTPEKAVMTIDGVEVDYSQPVLLEYGRHNLVLSANHYTQYTETLLVNSEYQTKVIDMISSDTTTAANNTGTTKSSKSSTNKTTESSNLTDGYTVSITEPKGASLYVDSVYIGVVPCSFEKKAGSKTITLSQSGYATVSYTISIANATGNLTYSFPDMVEKGSNTTTTQSN